MDQPQPQPSQVANLRESGVTLANAIWSARRPDLATAVVALPRFFTSFGAWGALNERDKLLTFACPKCNAPSGTPCTGARGAQPGHASRISNLLALWNTVNILVGESMRGRSTKDIVLGARTARWVRRAFQPLLLLSSTANQESEQ